jgi:integrase
MRTAEHSARELGSRASRARLPIQARPFFTHVQDGLSLGYRRGKRGGSFIARAYDTEHGYRYAPLGKSNDLIESVGMSFQQAQDAALQWYRQLAHIDAGDLTTGSYTVETLMSDYLADRKRETRKDMSRTRSVIDSHILPSLGSIEVSKLTHSKVKAWRDGIAETGPRIRVPKGEQAASRSIDTQDREAIRKRHATANRIFTVLRAALNFGYKRNRIATKAAWEKISPFRQVDAPKVRYLSIDECKRLIESCPADFRRLVRGALYTGMRYSELTALRVNAFNPASNTIHVAESKSGKSRFIALTDEGTAFFQSIADGKADDAFLFTHDEGRHDGEQWAHTQQTYWMNEACKEAKITPAVSFHILRHTYASQLAMNNTPMPVIAAQLGHADTRMTERHYAHLGHSYVADVVRANLPSFGFEIARPKLVRKSA